MGEKYTEAQKKASIKYLKEKTDSIQIRAQKGTKERWKDAATVHGKSLNQFIVDAVEAEIGQRLEGGERSEHDGGQQADPRAQSERME